MERQVIEDAVVGKSEEGPADVVVRAGILGRGCAAATAATDMNTRAAMTNTRLRGVFCFMLKVYGVSEAAVSSYVDEGLTEA